MSHHLRLNLHLVEFLARVDTNHASDHFRHYDHIPKMRLDEVGLLVGFRLLFRLPEFFDQAKRASLETPVESTPGSGVDYVTKLF